MSDQNQMQKFSVNVNGIDFDIVPNTVKKGKAAGQTKFRPDFNKFSLEDLVKAWPDKIVKLVRSTLQARTNGISDEAAAEAEGDEQKFTSLFTKYFSELSARGESLKALAEKRNELLEELAELSVQMATDPAAATRFAEVAKEIAEIQVDIASKKAKDEEPENTPAPTA